MNIVIGIVCLLPAVFFLICVVWMATSWATDEAFASAIRNTVKEHLDYPLKIHKNYEAKCMEVRDLEEQLCIADRTLMELRNNNRIMGETLNVWKEGVAKGFDTETIEEQVRWQGSGTRGDSAG